MDRAGSVSGGDRRVWPLGMVLLVLLVVAAAGPARAGYCAGDKARFLKTFERLRFDFEQAIGAVKLRIVQPVRLQAPSVIARLALWSLYVQSRQIVVEHLTAGDLDREKVDAIQGFWRRADQIRRSIGPTAGAGGGSNLAGLGPMLQDVFGSWAACRVVRDQEVRACDGLVFLDPDLADACRSPSLNVSRFSQRCMSFWYTVLEIVAAEANRYCQVSGASDGGFCQAALADVKGELASCSAVRNDDDSACKQRGLTARQRLECESILVAHRYLTGKTGEQAFRKVYRGGFVEAVANVGPAGNDCLWVALNRYDQYAAAFFFLQPSRLGALPDL